MVHDGKDSPMNGEMAIFCPACPQIGINVPPEMEWNEEDRYVDTCYPNDQQL